MSIEAVVGGSDIGRGALILDKDIGLIPTAVLRYCS